MAIVLGSIQRSVRASGAGHFGSEIRLATASQKVSIVMHANGILTIAPLHATPDMGGAARVLIDKQVSAVREMH